MKTRTLHGQAADGMRRGCRWLALLLLAIAASCDVATAAIPEAVGRARELAGRDADAAHRELEPLRAAAVARNDAATRLYIDEADCRILSDTSAADALRTAQAGISAASVHGVDRSAQGALLRLQACAGGLQLDVGETDAGSATLERVLAESGADARLADAHALALLERGLHRSRRGDLLRGQQDLLSACAALEALQSPQDLELCRSHLANHYKRMGDTEEALRLLEDLLQAARRRGATADVAVYVFSVAQVRHERHEWDMAAAAFAESTRLARHLNDRLGIAYAEHGLGHTLLSQDKPREALDHAREALRFLADGRDPVQQLRTTILEAKALSALGWLPPADADLRSIETRVRSSKDQTLLAEWLVMRSEVHARLGQWREAFESLAEWRPLNAQTQEQRLSEQSARLRLQFNRERDAAELAGLRRLNAKGDELLQAQRLALVLFLALLATAIGYAVRKVRHARHLHHLATVDELTGLPNRRASLAYLEDQLRQARELDRPLSVLMLDIDHFKAINDRHGHAKGDEVLRQVAQTLGAAVRLHDRAGRLGGEEFIVVLPGTPREAAHAIAERMRSSVQVLHAPNSPEAIRVTVSIGVAARTERDSVARLVARADEALYAAKAQGRNQVVSATRHESSPARARLEDEAPESG